MKPIGPSMETAGSEAGVTATGHFLPKTGTETEWNAAYYRLEDYLRALRIVNKVQQTRIILHCLRTAALRHAEDPEQNPTTVVMVEARALMEQWFGALSPGNEGGRAGGMISFLANDGPENWPAAFLAGGAPADFPEALSSRRVLTRPDLKVSSMVPKPIEYIQPTAILPPSLRARAAELIAVIGLSALSLTRTVFHLFRR